MVFVVLCLIQWTAAELVKQCLDSSRPARKFQKYRKSRTARVQKKNVRGGTKCRSLAGRHNSAVTKECLSSAGPRPAELAKCGDLGDLRWVSSRSRLAEMMGPLQMCS